ncbi:B3 domain-containing protein At5g42700-like [Papaver somniferum]|uniref:B3 domain-containing protein At5g42700-like n=1 Tax=Papaver somniferum TaxID=3469 RepID=UPI000E704459|nr:B3 domain-containing protein At5g42700-like [Papaver somniferum]
MATERAVLFQSTLGGANPSFVKSMRQSDVYNGYWLSIPQMFCVDHLPNRDAAITLVDSQGVEFDARYLRLGRGLTGGWKRFAWQHNLVHGDALVFERPEPTVFRVYIFRAVDV